MSEEDINKYLKMHDNDEKENKIIMIHKKFNIKQIILIES